MIDYLTILTVRDPSDAMMTKRLFVATNGAIGKTGYDNGLKFDVEVVPLNDLSDLAAVLLFLVDKPSKMVIRGEPVAGRRGVYRRLFGRNGGAFQPDASGHHWMFLDFDEVPLPMMIDPDDDPEIMLGYLVRLLPKEFHNACYFWQWSCGHGLDGLRTLRAHLWFWCDQKHTDRQYERWATWHNGGAGWKILDHCVFRTVQPNYTAAPVLGTPDKPVPDPVTTARCGVHIGDVAGVSIKIPSEDWNTFVRRQETEEYNELVEYGLRRQRTDTDYQISGSERYADYLGRIGDDKDGFYDPMTKAIWHWARNHSIDLDEDFKEALRWVVRSAVCTKQRDLDEYLSDFRLNESLRGAREKQIAPPETKLQNDLSILRRYSYIKRNRA